MRYDLILYMKRRRWVTERIVKAGWWFWKFFWYEVYHSKNMYSTTSRFGTIGIIIDIDDE